MQYITFMHNNTDTQTSAEEWEQFFRLAKASGLFQGGSAMGNRTTIGAREVPDVTDHIGGYMKFEAESLEALAELLQQHPVIVHGGTIEICELPKS